MEYVRVCNDLKDKGTLIPANGTDLSSIYKRINREKDNYASIYYFTEAHNEQFKKTGSVAGITDVTTDRLVWDFDSEDSVGIAQKDAVELVKRLKKEGYDDSNIRVFFSGNKGFDVSVQLKSERLTPREVKNVCVNLAEGLKTIDVKIYNATRILRLPLTKHPKSGLYKIPLSVEDLQTFTSDEIRTAAKDNLEYTDIKDAWGKGMLSKNILELKAKTPTLDLAEVTAVATDIKDIDWGKRPAELTPAKWLLELGHFGNGERSHAAMILASTYKNLGYDENKAYYNLKAAIHKQSVLNGGEKFPKEELWHNVIKQVYGPLWGGGTYSEKTDELLARLAAAVPEEQNPALRKDILSIDEVGTIFSEFAANIDQNRLEFGIASLDKNLDAMVGRTYIIGGSPGCGKCHGKGTKILKFDGTIVNVEDVKVGDLLMGDDSTPRTVLGLARGEEMLYNVAQANGDDYVINESHILSLKGSSTTKLQYAYGEVFDIQLTDYLQKGIDFKKRVKGYKVPVDFSKKELEIDPYILGAWLGDGTTSKPEFTAAVCETPLIDYINKWADSQNLHAAMKEYESGILTIRINGERQVNPFLNTLRTLKLTEGKYIPHNFLTSSREDRLQLLAGLLDTDGYYDVRKGTFEFSQSNEALMDQIVFLIRSLGFKTTKSTEMKHYKSFTKEKWYEGIAKSHRLYISGDNLNEIPTKLERKKAPAQNRQRFQDLTEIEVGPIGIGEYFGFELDGNHRYLLGDFTVTHNTSLVTQIANNTSLKNIQSIFFSFDMSLEDVYQKLIQKHYKITAKEVYDQMKDDARRKQFRETLIENYGNVHFIRSSGMTIEAMRNRITEIEKKFGSIKLIMVDYLDLVQGDFSDPTQKSMAGIQGLKAIGSELRKCMLILSQPNKANQKINEPVSTYAAIKGSSAVAELANAVLWLHRPGASARGFEDDKYMGIDCLKNRHGAMFALDFGWNGVAGTITEMTLPQKHALDNLRQKLKEEKAGANEDLF
ncbi:MAG: DnaB-like helicase C-terminal domain-containing protein [Bacteroidales bacterium]